MDSDEKLVEEQFTALSSALAGVVVPPSADRVRARGDRRRIRLITGSALATAVVAVLGVLIGLSVVAGRPGPSGPGTDGGPPLAIPSQFRLSHDGQAGWVRQTDRAEPSIFRPCAGSSPEPEDPTLVGRTDALTAHGPGTGAGGGPTVALTEQLLLFRDADASGAAVTALIVQKAACGWNVTGVTDGVPGADTDVLISGRTMPASGAGPAGYEEAVVLRRGNALWIRFLRVPDPGGPFSGHGDGPINVLEELCTMLHLCHP